LFWKGNYVSRSACQLYFPGLDIDSPFLVKSAKSEIRNIYS
jgi:hypothetical protein